MGFRVPAPDGKKERDGLAVMVLPEDTVIKSSYKVKYLTAGGMSIIYKAEKGGKFYIAKEVEASDTRNVMSLTQEKAVLERLNNPGIVEVFDLFEEDGFCYLIVEFVDGVTLDKKIPLGSDIYLAESLVKNWAFQLLDIFEYLHNQNPSVIYRDLKPKNIMLDIDNKIKLIDFGIARTFKEGKNQDTEHMGSMITASPEHYGGAQTDRRSDIYTIGATLHFILTNGKAIDCEPFDFPPVRYYNQQVTDNLASVIETALNTDPQKRFQTINEMRKALQGETRKTLQNEAKMQSIILPARPIEKPKEKIVESTIPKKEEPVKKTVKKSKQSLKKNADTIFNTGLGIIIGIILGCIVAGYFIWDNIPKEIPWREAKNNIGKVRIVEGTIEDVFVTSENNVYLNFTKGTSDTFRIFIRKESLTNFNIAPNENNEYNGKVIKSEMIRLYIDKQVRIKGSIYIYTFEGNKIPTVNAKTPQELLQN